MHEPERYLFLAQGHLVTFFHELLQVVLDGFIAAVPLQPRIDIFARLAIVLGHGFTLCALAWALRPALFGGLRIPLAALWATLYYIDVWDGYYVLLSPDYHTWIPGAGLLFTGLMARAVADGGALPVARYVQLGLFGGLVVGVKITLGALPAVASAFFLIADRPVSRARRGFLLAVILGEAIALAVLALSYWGHAGHVPTYVLRFAQFLVSAGPIDAMSVGKLQAIFTNGRASGLVAIGLLPFAMLAYLAFAKGRMERALPAALAAGALLYVYFVVKRFTPVTFLEAGVFLAAAVSLAAAVASSRWRWARFAPLVAVAAAIGCGAAQTHTLAATLSNLHANHAAQERLQAAVAAVPGRVAFLIPTNQYQFLSLEGALFKGTSDLETRAEVGQSPLSVRLLGNREFLFGERARYEHRPPAMTDYGAIAFTVPDGPEGIPGRVKALERNYNVSLAGFACGDGIDLGGRLAVVCPRGPNNRRAQ